MAKRQNPFVYDLLFKEFIVPSLADFVDKIKDEMLLCHIRTLKKYLSWMEQLGLSVLLSSSRRLKGRIGCLETLYFILD